MGGGSKEDPLIFFGHGLLLSKRKTYEKREREKETDKIVISFIVEALD